MPGSTIGKKMNLGYLGKISRDGDALVVNRAVSNEEDSLPIKFGSPVFLNDDNTVRNWKTGDTVNKFVGIAVATVIQATEYTKQESSYHPAKGCDILVRGSIIVELGTGTPKAGGAVYYNPTTNKFDTSETSGTTIAIPASFTTGYLDGKGSVEITILERNLI